MLLVSVVIRDTSSPGTGAQHESSHRNQCEYVVLCAVCTSFTGRSGIKESDLLSQHGLEDDALHRGVNAAHGHIICEVTYKLEHSTETQNVTI